MPAIRSKSFKARIYHEGSWGTSGISPEHDHTMDLWDNGNGLYTIEWACEALDMVQHIGIWTEDGKLTDYDGVMSLPKQAAELLREHGIEVSDDFL